MEITKELKEKLLKANSEEEVKALLGDAVKEEDVTKIWKEIEAHKADPDLKKVDDDELEAVNGGADRDYLKDGCSSSTNDSWCWYNDNCTKFWTTYSNYDPCPNGGNHEWVKTVRRGLFGEWHGVYMVCRKCQDERDATRSEGGDIE